MILWNKKMSLILPIMIFYNTNHDKLTQPRWDNRQITPLAVISIFSLTLVSHNICTAARLESRANLRGTMPHIEYPWAVSQLSENLLDVFAGSLNNSTYFHPGLHFIMNVKLGMAKLLFNNAFVICVRAAKGVRPNKQKTRSISPGSLYGGRERRIKENTFTHVW